MPISEGLEPRSLGNRGTFESEELRRVANESHLSVLKEGVRAWNQWRRANPLDQAILVGADLSQVDLSGTGLRSANLGDSCEAQNQALMPNDGSD